MPLLNYTTKIEAETTSIEIQRMLAKFGARKIISDFDSNGEIFALSFSIIVKEQEIGFRLPIESEPVLLILRKQGVTPKLQTMAQARRVAWRIVKDWVEAQLAIIETKMVEPEQVFLPYMVQGNGQTLYENMVNSRFLLEEKNTN